MVDRCLYAIYNMPNPFLNRKRPLRGRTEKSFLMELLNLGHAEPFWVFERGGALTMTWIDFLSGKKLHSLTDKIIFLTCEKKLNRNFFEK